MEERKKGLRCQICTGCGLCPGVTAGGQTEGLRVLTADVFWGEKKPLNGGGRRLAAADIGTTTIAMLLYGEDGTVADRYMTVNPQIVYGADVLSRIQAAEDAAKAADMREKVRNVLRQGIRRFQKKLAPEEELCLVSAANTTMSYLFQGFDVRELGQAPFFASRTYSHDMDMAKPMNMDFEIEGVPVLGFPGLSAFVGGDILAGILACGMADQEELTLLIDLGTNGEIVLGNRRRRIACATAAGPAFEGGANRGVWGADMISILAALKKEGCMDETGLLSDPFFENGIRVGNVPVTERTVRSIQLAKAAVAAGIEILLEKYGTGAAGVDRVILAGGFGYYLKPSDAVRIGLLASPLADRAIAGGNTALSGCLAAGRMIFASGRAALEEKLEEIAAGTEIINLAQEPSFEKTYLERMNFSEIPIG